ncbi:MAG: hypothetical protein ACI8QZ_003345 [Chlamydiales bacterium]|jgi:hypothetical protein
MRVVSKSGPAMFIVSLLLLLESPVSGQSQDLLALDDPLVQSVMQVQDAYTPLFMSQPAVLGTATGLGDDGEVAIIVFVNEDSPESARTARGFATEVKGVKVWVRLTSPFLALKGGPGGGGGGGGGADHLGIQTPPIQLGCSGGWGQDLANGYCCGGTLGALIQVGGQQRILSNYHVFEADIVNGGNGTTAQTGDPIIQPGLIDVNCNAGNSQNVATLVKSSALPGNNVDCSSANIISGMVRTDGAILEVGVLSSATTGASVNQAVKKSGRTSGLTRSKVSGLNATISVSYENECAGGAAFTRTFTGQILISNKGTKFLKGGDSGSLMVEDVTTNPRAVGLLFAGSSSIAVANPIGDVLSFFGASMVGN